MEEGEKTEGEISKGRLKCAFQQHLRKHSIWLSSWWADKYPKGCTFSKDYCAHSSCFPQGSTRDHIKNQTCIICNKMDKKILTSRMLLIYLQIKIQPYFNPNSCNRNKIYFVQIFQNYFSHPFYKKTKKRLEKGTQSSVSVPGIKC